MEQTNRPNEPFLILDTETTGLNSYVDELLEVCVIDSTGAVLFHSYLTPERVKQWPRAEQTHGISPAFIFGGSFPTYRQVEPYLTELLAGRDVVIYNVEFDSAFLTEPCKAAKALHCAQLAFARYYKEPHYYGGYKWKSLAFATEYIGYKFEGKAHSALTDCKAALAVWQWVNDTEKIAATEAARKEAAEAIEAEEIAESLYYREKNKAQFAANRRRDRFTAWYYPANNLRDYSDMKNARESLEAFLIHFYGLDIERNYQFMRRPHLPIYERRSIPANLLPPYKEVHFLRQVEPVGWSRARYNSLTLVYDWSQLTEQTDYLRVYGRDEKRPADLYTKSQLLRQFKVDAGVWKGLEPVALAKSGYGNVYPLYQYNPTPEELRRYLLSRSLAKQK